MGIVVLFVLQLAVALAGFVALWRRLAQTRAELEDLRQRLQAFEGERAQQRRAKRIAPSEATVTETVETESPHARAVRAWSGATRTRQRAAPAPMSDDLRIGAALGVVTLLPALAFVFGAGGAAPVCIGVLVAAAMMALALRDKWQAAAWAAGVAAAAWSAIGFAIGVPHTDPEAFSAVLAVAGVAGCLYAQARRPNPGAVLATVAAAAALLLGAQSDMIGPAGAAYGVILVTAAITGAANLRLEGFHVGAFLASLLGLFALSGQPSAAIWFTPAASLSGALFFGIAAVRTPQLGSRGVTLAGAGVVAALTAVATLSVAQYGLADRSTAGGAFLFVAAAFAGLLVLTARPRAERLASLGATLWILAIATSVALAAAIVIAVPEPIGPPALACLALLAAVIDERFTHAVWRVQAIGLALGSTALAVVNAGHILSESAIWPSPLATGLAVALPAALFAFAAWRVRAKASSAPDGLFEFLAGALAIVTADLAARLSFSGGAVKLNPVSFVEAGVHIAIWLAAALVITLRDKGRGGAARRGASAALGVAAIAATGLAGILWFTPYWQQRPGLHEFPAPLGFLAPAAFFAAHWALLRARGSQLRTRLAFGACALSLAAAAVLALAGAERTPSWTVVLGAALAFGAGIAINFAPGVVLYSRSRRNTRQPA